MEKSLKNQAEEIIESVDHDLQGIDTKVAAVQKEVDVKANAIMEMIFNVVSNVDIEAAVKRVEALKEAYPDTTAEALAQKLIRDKCQRTGAVGAVTSGAGLIPGLGTAAAVTLGVAADIGATFKLQAELVLEIAAVYDYPLSDEEKQQLVMVITGVSAGTSALARRAGQSASIKLGEQFAEKAILKALPIIGVIASAGTNVLSTYIIGQRADAYFRLGPETVGSWTDSLRAISGVDERKIGAWLAESGKATGAAIASGVEIVGEAGKATGAAIASGAEVVGETGKAAGEAVASGAGKVAGAVGSGTKKAGQAAQAGLKAYFRWAFGLWLALFRGIGKLLGFIWAVIMFLPRQIARLFKRSA